MIGLLLALAVLVWPVRRARRGAGRRGGPWSTGHGAAAPAPSATRPPRHRHRYRPGGRRRRRAADEADLLLVLELLGPALRAGLPVTAALEGPGSATALGSALQAAGRAGLPLAPVWGAWARRTGAPGGRVVERVWWLGERLGSPLAEAVEDAAEGVRADVDRRRRVASAVAGPRSTALLLTLLPVVGPVLSLAVGLRPEELWGGVGAPLAVGGAVLVLVGHLWCAALLRTVTRPARAAAS